MANQGTVAYYLRLSRTDGDLGADGKNESNSIESQRTLLEEYQSRSADLGGNPRLRYRPEEFHLPHLEYVDDGYTGTNFERPGFQQLLADCRKGLVATILVKDMSRLGRNYIEVGDYIEQIFPLLGVRLIAVTERFDTGTSEGVDFGIAVENLINTLYVKDCAKKARAARRAKWKKGMLTSRRTPLGYACDDLREGWKIDEGGADIVRAVFAEAEKGHGTGMIADTLNSRGIPTPYVYLKGAGLWEGSKKVGTPKEELLWDATMVWRILRNETYTGTLVQGKRESIILGDGSHSRGVSDGELYKTENAHEAIVSDETFRKAQMVIRYAPQSECRAERNYALKAVVRCGNCRRLMCFEYGTYGDNMHCTRRRVKKSRCSRDSYPYGTLESVVLAAIRQMGLLCGSLLEKMETRGNAYDAEPDKKRICQIKARKVRSYEEYADGQQTREQFLAEKEKLAEELVNLERRVSEAEVEENHRKDVAEKLESVQTAGKVAEESHTLTHTMVSELIEAVYVYDRERIEVVFKYEDAIREAIEQCGLEPKTDGE